MIETNIRNELWSLIWEARSNQKIIVKLYAPLSPLVRELRATHQMIESGWYTDFKFEGYPIEDAPYCAIETRVYHHNYKNHEASVR